MVSVGRPIAESFLSFWNFVFSPGFQLVYWGFFFNQAFFNNFFFFQLSTSSWTPSQMSHQLPTMFKSILPRESQFHPCPIHPLHQESPRPKMTTSKTILQTQKRAASTSAAESWTTTVKARPRQTSCRPTAPATRKKTKSLPAKTKINHKRREKGEFCFPSRRHTSWRDDSDNSDTCLLQKGNILPVLFDLHQPRSKSGFRTIDTRPRGLDRRRDSNSILCRPLVEWPCPYWWGTVSRASPRYTDQTCHRLPR